MNEWQRREAELLAKETAYLGEYNAIEKVFDNHIYFCLVFAILLMAGFLIGFLIGMML